MLIFLLRRSLTMLLTAACLTFIVFFLTNLPPNLEKIAKSEAGSRITDAEVTSWLGKNGYLQPLPVRYGEWLGVVPGWTRTDMLVRYTRATAAERAAAEARRLDLGNL